MGDGNKQTEWFQVLRTAMNVTQLGLSLVAPLLLCVLLTVWLKDRFSLGSWVVLVGIGIGLASMALTFYRFIRGYLHQSRKQSGAGHTAATEEKPDADLNSTEK